MTTPMPGPRRPRMGFMVPIAEGNMNGKTPRWADFVAMAQAAEAAGFDSLWFADHLLYRFPEVDESGPWEALSIIAAVAAVTKRIEIGALVACTSFRNPALLAKMADTIDEISGGRFILGLGAGWHQPEYDAFGYPFDHLASRFEEAITIITGLLREGHVDFAGDYYTARDCTLRPRGPSPKGPRILIGAKQPRMLRLVAKHADAWNTCWHDDPQPVADAWQNALAACADTGRDPATLELTVGAVSALLAPGEAGNPKGPKIAGSPEEVAKGLMGFAEVGATHLIVHAAPRDAAGIERYGEVIRLMDEMAG
jgi:probable F420-dependent oxidoreductase